MTIGNVGNFPNSPLSLGPDTYKKIWTGTDGKYESHDGFNRLKWNNYSADIIGSSVKYPYFKIKKEFIPDPTSPGGTVIEEVPVSWNNGILAFDEPQFYTPAYRPLSECLSKLLERVKGHDFNLGVELGQLHQTVGLLSGTLRSLGRAALALRRGDFATAARCLGASPRPTRLKASDISGRWLELQYGWLPLLSTCYSAAEAYAALTEGPRRSLFKVAKSRDTVFNITTAPNTYSLKFEGEVRVSVWYEMYEEMSITRQLGLQDPASILWELTPWSFVVDWFIPFGEYLNLLNQIPKLKGRWLVTSTLKCNWQTVAAKYLATNFGGPNWRGTILESPNFRWMYNKVQRVYQENPPGIPFPKFVMGLNSSRRFWNAVSLAHQRFK